MQLTTLLLIIVAILTALSGIAVFSGAHKGERVQAFLFLFTTVAALLWAVGIGIFLSLPADADANLTNNVITMYYVAAPIMCWGLMAYACHKFRWGQIAMVMMGVICAIYVSAILINHACIYSGFTLSNSVGNVVHLRQGLFYITYGIYCFLAVGLYIIGLGRTICATKVERIKKANLMVLIGFTITGVLALIFNLILPYFGKYDTIWVGIIAMSVAWIFHYYAILRYRLLDLSSPWLRGFSRIIVMSLAAIIYLVIFFVIFAALFRVPVPSGQVIILNAIMIIAVMLLFPALNEISTFVGSLASIDVVDVSYIVKKLTALVGYDINLEELASFLSDHMHFQYVGFVMDGSLYGSKKLRVTPEVVNKVSKLKKSSGSIWLEPDDDLANALRKLDIAAVAELRDSKGRIIGQMLLGRSTGHISFENRDLVPVEIILQIVPVVIHPGNHRIKKHLV